jgi:hypothetical protein
MALINPQRRLEHLARLPVRVAAIHCDPAALREHLPLARVTDLSGAFADDPCGPIAVRDAVHEACLRAGAPFDLLIYGGHCRGGSRPSAQAVLEAAAEAMRGIRPGGMIVLALGARSGLEPHLALLTEAEPGTAEITAAGVLFVRRRREVSREGCQTALPVPAFEAAMRDSAGVRAPAAGFASLAGPPAGFASLAGPPPLRPWWAPLLEGNAAKLLSARLVLITPCSRPGNLEAIRALLRPHAARISAWLVVHDADAVPPGAEGDRPLEGGRERHEALRRAGSKAGNAQRNRALEIVAGTTAFDDDYIYFVDDDNVVHPGLWDLPLKPGGQRMLCFDTYDVYGTHGLFRAMPRRVNLGSTPRLCRIDTAQVAVGVRLWKDAGAPAWRLGEYCADGYFIQDLATRFPEHIQYVAEILALSNYLNGPAR